MNGARDDVDRMFSLLADGQLDETEGARLGELLRGDPELRGAYLDYMTLHALLQWEQGDVEASTPTASVSRPTRFSRTWIAAAVVAAIAASAILAVAVWMSDDSRLAADTKDSTETTTIAPIIAESKHAHWESRGESVGGRDHVYALRSGIARIDLQGGGSIAMVGPCELEVLGPSSVRLISGRITARASESQGDESQGDGSQGDGSQGDGSQGDVHIETDVASFSGKAAEFGLFLEPDRFVRVHTLRGSVQAIMNAENRKRIPELLQGDAYSFDVATGRAERIRVSSTRFPRPWSTLPEGPEVFGAVRFDVKIPDTLLQGSIQSDHDILLFPESKGKRVTIDLSAVRSLGQIRGPRHERSVDVVPAGTVVDSYLLHFDATDTPASNRLPISGTIVFDRPIVGIIVGQQELELTDVMFGNPETHYDSGSRTGTDLGQHPFGMWTEISKGRREMMFGIGLSSRFFELRILVEPESQELR